MSGLVGLVADVDVREGGGGTDCGGKGVAGDTGSEGAGTRRGADAAEGGRGCGGENGGRRPGCGTVCIGRFGGIAEFGMGCGYPAAAIVAARFGGGPFESGSRMPFAVGGGTGGVIRF